MTLALTGEGIWNLNCNTICNKEFMTKNQSTMWCKYLNTEGSCLMLLFGPGQSYISQKWHKQNFYLMYAVTKWLAHNIELAKF